MGDGRAGQPGPIVSPSQEQGCWGVTGAASALAIRHLLANPSRAESLIKPSSALEEHKCQDAYVALLPHGSDWVNTVSGIPELLGEA